MTKSKLCDDLGAIREVSRFQPQNGTMYAKRSEFQQLRRYFNLLSNRLTPENSQKRPGVLSEPPNLWTTEVSHFFAILFDAPTSAATKMFPVCQGCGATVHWWADILTPSVSGVRIVHQLLPVPFRSVPFHSWARSWAFRVFQHPQYQIYFKNTEVKFEWKDYLAFLWGWVYHTVFTFKTILQLKVIGFCQVEFG